MACTNAGSTVAVGVAGIARGAVAHPVVLHKDILLVGIGPAQHEIVFFVDAAVAVQVDAARLLPGVVETVAVAIGTSRGTRRVRTQAGIADARFVEWTPIPRSIVLQGSAPRPPACSRCRNSPASDATKVTAPSSPVVRVRSPRQLGWVRGIRTEVDGHGQVLDGRSVVSHFHPHPRRDRLAHGSVFGWLNAKTRSDTGP